MAHKDIIREVQDLLVPRLAAIDANRHLARKDACPFLIASRDDPPAYVQALASHKGPWLYLEATSLQSMPELGDLLTGRRRRRLKALGFEPPNELCCNYALRLRGGSSARIEKAARLLAEALVRVFGLRRAADLLLEVRLLVEGEDGAIHDAPTVLAVLPGAPIDPDEDDKLYRIESWAVEIEDEPGVRLYQVRSGSLKPLYKALDAEGVTSRIAWRVEEWTATTRQPPCQRVPDHSSWGVGQYRYDPTARCWRPPGQPFAPPESKPLEHVALRMVAEPPDAGWLPVRLEAGDAIVTFSASNVFDPFHPALDALSSDNWVAWLKAIAEGQQPRLAIDLEGHFLEFHILDPQDDTVRFLVAAASQAGWRPELDLRIERRALIEALYRPLLALWESDAFNAAWRQWCFLDSEPDFEAPWPVRSSLLDAWLG